MIMHYCFDLDGTLITGYTDRPDKDFAAVKLLPGVLEMWNHLHWKTGNSLSIITNQGGVAFGYHSEADVQRKLCAVGAELGYGWIELHDGAGAAIDLDTGLKHNPHGVLQVFVCYGDARSPVPHYRDASRRKPSGAMIRESMATQHETQATFVGDRPEDEAAAADAGVTFQWANAFFEAR
jgi:D-glycero-D-manno-heptose 1,7-bisphosphate phosphatase